MTSGSDAQVPARGDVVWAPSAAHAETSNLGRFMAYLAEQGRSFAGYADLHEWSVADLGGFWRAVTDWSGVIWHDAPSEVIGDRSMPGARWFPGGTLNYAEHALRAATERPDDLAVIAVSESRDRVELSWADLSQQVAACRAGLARLGVGHGDRVAAYLPNGPEALIGFLAAASLGAIWTSCPPEFGTRAVLDRFAQLEPSVLLAADGYVYGAKQIDRLAEVERIVEGLPSVRHTIGVRHLGIGPDGWGELTAGPGPIDFVPVAVDHPLYVLYSSGTTGLPKGIVHGHGGITVEHLKVLQLHADLRPTDRYFWYTTTGWMMWNFLVSGLLTGSMVVLYDGNPAWPDQMRLWDLAADEGVTAFGVSAAFLLACRKAGLRPGEARDLSALRTVNSTGSPLPPEGFEWIVDAVSATAQPCSASGGTDVCSGFVGMAPVLPVRAGEIACSYLGCAVASFDADGRQVPPGQTGELVVTEPMPSMPVGLWGDADGSRYREAYFDQYPGVWRHGDWVRIFDDGSCLIEGRSDATMNRGGVRLGTSELYSAVEAVDGVVDSLIVHAQRPGDDSGMGELVLFVHLQPGADLDDGLGDEIRRRIREELSPRHVPDRILAVPGIPRTLSGKKLEVPVKRLLQGAAIDEVASPGSLQDPAALDAVHAAIARSTV